jgi:hypothetical protein
MTRESSAQARIDAASSRPFNSSAHGNPNRCRTSVPKCLPGSV